MFSQNSSFIKFFVHLVGVHNKSYPWSLSNETVNICAPHNFNQAAHEEGYLLIVNYQSTTDQEDLKLYTVKDGHKLSHSTH